MTPKQSAFVRYKLMGLSNRIAVVEAGYSGFGSKQQGTKLMRHAAIRAALLKGGFDLATRGREVTRGFQASAGRWLAVSPSMPKKVYDEPIEFLTDAMNCEDLPIMLRLRFAKALLPYQHAKIGR